jgi:hypothetical protein
LSLVEGEHLIRVEGSFGDVVDFVVFTTDQGQVAQFGTPHAIVTNPSAPQPSVGPPSPAAANNFLYEAPPGFQIFAIWGNSGQLLDALGVILRETNAPILKAPLPKL